MYNVSVQFVDEDTEGLFRDFHGRNLQPYRIAYQPQTKLEVHRLKCSPLGED